MPANATMTKDDRRAGMSRGAASDALSLRRIAMALALAYLLVLQAVLGGLASGTHAAASTVSAAFGPVLCLGAHDGTDVPADPSHHLPDCCTLGCQVASGASLTPEAATAPLPSPAWSEAETPPAHPARAVLAAERTPRHTRAPPLA